MNKIILLIVVFSIMIVMSVSALDSQYYMDSCIFDGGAGTTIDCDWFEEIGDDWNQTAAGNIFVDSYDTKGTLNKNVTNITQTDNVTLYMKFKAATQNWGGITINGDAADSPNEIGIGVGMDFTFDQIVILNDSYAGPSFHRCDYDFKNNTWYHVDAEIVNQTVTVYLWEDGGIRPASPTCQNTTGGMPTGDYYKLISDDDVDKTFRINETGIRILQRDYIDINLNSPADDSSNTSTAIQFAYTPEANSTFTSCDLWTNETSWSNKESNTSNIINGSANYISETFSSNGAYLWAVACETNVSNMSISDNFTITIESAVPVIYLNISNDTVFTEGDIDFIFTPYVVEDEATLYIKNATEIKVLATSDQHWRNVTRYTDADEVYWGKDTTTTPYILADIIINDSNNWGADVFIMLGDNFDSLNDAVDDLCNGACCLNYLDESLPYYQDNLTGLDSDYVYYVVGNHDPYRAFSSGGNISQFYYDVSENMESFCSYNGTCTPDRWVSYFDTWYNFTVGGVTFIILNTAYLNNPEAPEPEPTWFNATLDLLSEPIIPIMHNPISDGGGGGYDDVTNEESILSRLDLYSDTGIALFGHIHHTNSTARIFNQTLTDIGEFGWTFFHVNTPGYTMQDFYKHSWMRLTIYPRNETWHIVSMCNSTATGGSQVCDYWEFPTSWSGDLDGDMSVSLYPDYTIANTTTVTLGAGNTITANLTPGTYRWGVRMGNTWSESENFIIVQEAINGTTSGSNLTVNVFDEENPATAIEKFVAQFIAGAVVNTFGINKTFIDEDASTSYGNFSFDNDFNTNSTTLETHNGVGYEESSGHINGSVLVGNSESICVEYVYRKTGTTGAGGTVNASINIVVDDTTVGQDFYYQSNSAAVQDSGTVRSCYDMSPDSVTDDVNVYFNFSSYTAGGDKSLFMNFYVTELFIEEQINESTLVINQSDLIDGVNIVLIEDADEEYLQREYTINVSAGSGDQWLVAYLIKTTEDLATVIFTVTNVFGNPISGANVNVEKIIGSEYITVTDGLTDDIGSFQAILVNNDPYRATISLTGFNTRIVNFRAQTREISIILNQTVNLDLVTLFQDIWISIEPQIISYNSTDTYHNVSFNYTINSNSSLLTEYGFALYCNNTWVASQSGTTSNGGFLTTTYNVVGCDNVSMQYNFTKNDTSFYQNTVFWYPNVQQQFGLNEALWRMFGEYDTSTLNFFMIIIFIIVAGALTVISPEVAALAWLPIGGIFVYYGILSTTLFMLIGITMLSVIFIKRRWL